MLTIALLKPLYTLSHVMASCKYCYSLLALIGLSTSDWVNMTTYPRLPRSTSFMALGSYNDVVFILGGYSTEVSISKQVVQYSATNKNFTDPGKRLNYNVWGGGDFYTQIDNTVYFLSTSGSNLNTFDMANRVYTSSWKSVSTSVSYTSCLTSASISNIDYIYVVGGYGSTPLSKVQVLKTSTMQWLSGIPSMITRRNRLSCIVDPSTLHLYAIAGKNGAGTNSASYLKTIEKVSVNNMAQNQWQFTSSTLTQPAIGARSILHDERILIIGGRYFDGNGKGITYLDIIHVIDPQTDTVTLPYASLPRGVAQAAAVIVNNNLYIFGGNDCPNQIDYCYGAYDDYMILPLRTSSSSPTHPTNTPTHPPTKQPTALPSKSPAMPTNIPTLKPTSNPTTLPPTYTPSLLPTNSPTLIPTTSPTAFPVLPPTYAPSVLPTNSPTALPTTYKPTLIPTKSPVTLAPLPVTMTPTIDTTSNPATQTSNPPSPTDSQRAATSTQGAKTQDHGDSAEVIEHSTTVQKDAIEISAPPQPKDEVLPLIIILFIVLLGVLIAMHVGYRYKMKKQVKRYKESVNNMNQTRGAMDVKETRDTVEEPGQVLETVTPTKQRTNETDNNDKDDERETVDTEGGKATDEGLAGEGVMYDAGQNMTVGNRRKEGSFSVRVTGGTTKGRPDFYCEETIGGDDFVIQGDDFVIHGDDTDDEVNEVHETIK
eukprot:154085_1